jgi:hypothetical protein
MTGLYVSDEEACMKTAAYSRITEIEDADMTASLKRQAEIFCVQRFVIHI